MFDQGFRRYSYLYSGKFLSWNGYRCLWFVFRIGNRSSREGLEIGTIKVQKSENLSSFVVLVSETNGRVLCLNLDINISIIKTIWKLTIHYLNNKGFWVMLHRLYWTSELLTFRPTAISVLRQLFIFVLYEG